MALIHPATIVVLAHNRHEAVATTLSHLMASGLDPADEVVLVDDGSTPPIVHSAHPQVRGLRTDGVERSHARNQGALAARNELLVFLDDDISVPPGFADLHRRAFVDFGGVLAVGKIDLSAEFHSTPFGRFRQSIEAPSQNRPRGLVVEDNFCTAANMSIRRQDFLHLGGFDPAILSGEDQDLALRFSNSGGKIVFLPEACAVHRDSVQDIGAYGRRHEWGARAMAPFLRRYPERPENRVRARFENGRDATISKLAAIAARRAFSANVAIAVAESMARVAEGMGINDRPLLGLYHLILGMRLFRGFRAGLSEWKDAPPLPGPLSS